MAALRYALISIVLLLAVGLLVANWYTYAGPYIVGGSPARLDGMQALTSAGWEPYMQQAIGQGEGEWVYLRRARLHF